MNTVSVYTIYFLNIIIGVYSKDAFVCIFTGIIIITLLIYDINNTEIQLNIYQICLIYFYFSLVVGQGYNKTSLHDHYYWIAFVINFIHLISFALGYNIISYRRVERKFIKSKFKLLKYILFPMLMSIILFDYINLSAMSYSTMYATWDSAVRLPIYRIGVEQISAFIFVHVLIPVLGLWYFVVYNFANGLYEYLETGVKGYLVEILVVSVFLLQIIYRPIKKSLLIPGIYLGIMMMLFAWSFTVFRDNLGYGLINWNFESQLSFVEYFFNKSSETSHIAYTKNVVEELENGEFSIRYGFDYFRTFLHPIKWAFEDGIGYSSYQTFAKYLYDSKTSGGVYVGLAGELYWNFWLFFPAFSFFIGAILKIFSNWTWSGSVWGMIAFICLGKEIIWFLYRGQANAMINVLMFYVITIIILKIVTKLNVYRHAT
jgi:hypothetical protein